MTNRWRNGVDTHGGPRRCETFSRRSCRWSRDRRRRRSSGISARSRSWRRWRTAGKWPVCWSGGCPTWRSREKTHASTTTVTRVAHWLRHGEGGYRLALDRERRPPESRRPGQGPPARPVVSLLEDAGLGPEQPGERALAFPCRNAPVEVLLVRAADVPEYVQDGVVDCGITGIDLVRERGARRARSCCSSASARAASRRAVPGGVARTVVRGPRRRFTSPRSTRASRASCCRSTSSSST